MTEDKKHEGRKRKHKTAVTPNVKKKITATDVEAKKSELSNEDKELLQRWSNMQKDKKPFIHPIRQHMDELMQLQAESLSTQPAQEMVKGQPIIDRVSNKQLNTLQFTNFVPKQRDGGVALVREQTIRIPPVVNVCQAVTSGYTSTVTSTISATTTVVPSVTASHNQTTVPSNGK